VPSWLSPVERLAVNQSVKGPNPFDGATFSHNNFFRPIGSLFPLFCIQF
jgi:hypothetical protein